VGVSLPAQELKEFEKKVNEFTLPNGLHFVVVERHDAPEVCFHTYVAAGGVYDPPGQTGLAQLLVRLAFKGTETIGTRNWSEEKQTLDAIEDAYDRADLEANKAAKADWSRVETLRTQARLAIDTAQRSAAPDEYLRVLKENGALEPLAEASAGAAEFAYTLPSNRAELWFLLESQRLAHPVFREFYAERDAGVAVFHRRYESAPQSSLLGQVLTGAFEAHPYHNPATGWPGDLANLRYRDAKAFFDRYYVPANITIAIVGDVIPAETKRMAERYFGAMPAKPIPPAIRAEEQRQFGPRTTVMELAGQPQLVVAYKRPAQNDPDAPVFDAIQLLLAQGHTGLLNAEMVRERHLAVQAQALASFPDGRYPNLFAILLVVAPGHTVEDNQQALQEILQRLKTSPVDAQALARAKAQGRAERWRRIGDNRDLAGILAMKYANFGDWRKAFTGIEDLNKVTAEDLSRVANRYFVATGRTTAYSVPPGQADPPKPRQIERKTGGAL
jgi:predicted Zn-dependent peptidase